MLLGSFQIRYWILSENTILHLKIHLKKIAFGILLLAALELGPYLNNSVHV
jgi:hypothetical protein